MDYSKKSGVHKRAIALLLSVLLIFTYSPIKSVYADGGVLTSLEVLSQPKVSEYTVGDSFSSKGLKVVANYSDGDIVNIANKDLDFTYDFSASGKKDVTISYNDGTTTKSTSVSVDVYVKPTISTDNIKAKVGDVIEIPVSIKDNPGLMGIKMVVEYDDTIVKPVEVCDTDIFTTGYVNDNIATSEDNSFNIIWNGTENMSSDGKLITIKFLCLKNPDSAKTEIDISTDRSDTYTEKYNTISTTSCKSVVTFDAVKSVAINYTSIAIRKGTKYQLQASTKPEEYDFEWSSADEGIATVDETGKVTGVASGETKIVASLKDDADIYSECVVKVLEGEEIEHEHEWTEKVLKDATCEEDGSKLFFCSICGESNEQKIDKLGHDFGEYISDNNASCMEDGTKTAICSRCKGKDTVTDEGSAIGHHTWGEFVTKTEAKCETKGLEVKTCSVCQAEESRDIDPLGHDYGEYISDNNATCLKDGTKTAVCSRCKGKDTIVDEGSAKGHTIVDDKAVAATCTEPGKTEGKHCSACGEIITRQEVVPVKGHKWDKGVITKAATCTQDGVMTFTCENDKSHTKTEVIKATGHNWDDGVVTTSPTAKKEGVLTITCKTCKVTRTVVIPATGENIDTDQPPVTPEPDKSKVEDGAGTLSADGKTLTDEEGVKYLVASKVTTELLVQNAAIADKTSASKYKITKVTKKNGKIIGGTVTYTKPYNKNCKTATVKATVKIAGVTFKVTTVEKNAFKGCTNLTKVTIGKNVTQIGKNAFNGCGNLKTIIIKAVNLKKVGTKAFNGINYEAKFKLYKKKYSKYKKLIKKAKAPKTVRYVKQ